MPPTPVDEMWFWSEGYQAAEREAEGGIEARRYQTFDDMESFMVYLTTLASS